MRANYREYLDQEVRQVVRVFQLGGDIETEFVVVDMISIAYFHIVLCSFFENLFADQRKILRIDVVFETLDDQAVAINDA